MTRYSVCFLALFSILSFTSVASGSDIALRNWNAPATWTPIAATSDGRIAPMVDLSGGPLPFFPITPCRVADTRGFGFSGVYGPPVLSPSGERTFVITGQCGIPSTAKAVSSNFTVAEMGSPGNLKVWPDGSTPPTVSTVNWTGSTFVIANAAITPLGVTGAIHSPQ